MTAMIPLSDLTQAKLDGQGIFDVLMQTTKAHLESEFSKNRIRGPEYATVYLGSLESVLRTSLDFLVQRQRVVLEAELMEQQVLVAQAEVAKANAAVLVAQAEVEKVQLELEILELSKDKIPAEITHLQAQTALSNQQKLNLISEELGIDARTALTTQQTANALIEQQVLQAQKCKLDAEFDLLGQQVLKSGQETALLTQKVVTERAQVAAIGVDDNSVIGKQKLLYKAQTDGFQRDAEQKAAKALIDTWQVRRTTNEETVAGQSPNGGADNGLGDANIGRVVAKLLTGVGA